MACTAWQKQYGGITIKRFDLGGKWTIKSDNINAVGHIPGSVYSVLLENGLMDDPFYRDNEIDALSLMDHDYEFIKEFDYKSGGKTLLCFDGVDTLSTVFLNGVLIGTTANMHRRYEFDVSDVIKEKNELKLKFPSITDEFKKAYEKEPIFTEPSGPLGGAKNFRKAFCMSGWDWVPRLPDMGIWRDVYLEDLSTARIKDFEIIQRKSESGFSLEVIPEIEGDATAEITLLSPDKKEIKSADGINFFIDEPLLWWPNGYGAQPLYEVTVAAYENGEAVDVKTKYTGLRTIELVREPDKFGESYYHKINGLPIFAMGACYIPEDSILSRRSKERTEKLLDACVFSNFNTIRVWGGGFYHDDYFFDLCDQKGLLVFEDMMFACSSVSLDKNIQNDFLAETEENLKRIRHHACLAVICGNNEMEWFTDKNSPYGKIYLEIFEDKLPKIANNVCPYLPYVPSSPTSKGGFDDPNNENNGDCHYWDVWLNDKPFSEYREKYFRYLSEFGFESLPDIKTVNSFTEPNDRNLFSRIMERHQRCIGGNKKIIQYISDTYKYPDTLQKTIYLSQLLQAEAMKYGVEHLRSNRGRCMGTLYWQLNDMWPVSSWSSIDYYGRFKALQYFAKRFFAPIMICCKETGEHTTRNSVVMQDDLYPYETKAQISVCNETGNDVSGTVLIELRANTGEVLFKKCEKIHIPKYSVTSLEETDFNKTDVLNNYLCYSFSVNGEIVSSGTSLFTQPKHFNFPDPKLRCEIKDDEITVFAENFAKSVCISSDSDILLSDNYFDIFDGKKTVKILSGTPENIKLTSIYNI